MHLPGIEAPHQLPDGIPFIGGVLRSGPNGEEYPDIQGRAEAADMKFIRWPQMLHQFAAKGGLQPVNFF